MTSVAGTVAFLVAALTIGVVLLLVLGRAAGEVAGFRCPRCHAGAAWLGSGFGPSSRGRTVHSVFCLRCRAFLRVTWSGRDRIEFR